MTTECSVCASRKARVRSPQGVRSYSLVSFVAVALLSFGCSDEQGSPTDLDSDNGAASELPLLRLGERVSPATLAQLRHGRARALPIGRDESRTVVVEHAATEGSYVALNGHVEGAETSRFILKGEEDALSGWLVLRDENRAYIYRTVDGNLEVEAVPVERIYPVCNLPRPSVKHAHNEPVAFAPSGAESFIGTYTDQNLLKLQSRPGAKKVLFLDIGDVMNGDTPKDFSKEQMWRGWAGVAAGYSSFQVNVTTDPDVYEAAGVSNSGIARFTSSNDRAFCALGAFGTREGCDIFTGPEAEPEEGYGVGRTTLHEFGHLLGLSHDGTNSEEYFTGFSEFSWAPIMGNYYANYGKEPLNQWSKGEYGGAIEKEDDLDIITDTLPYVEDDVPDTKPLTIQSGNVSSVTNRGQIGKNTDTDKFTFSIAQATGHVTLNIDRIEDIGGSMLDVEARLLNGSGQELAKNNPKAARGAKLNLDVPMGTYTLVIAGGAEGTPSNGFSTYSSIGYYGIKGTIDGAGNTGGAGGSGGAGGTGGSGGVSGGGSGGTSSAGASSGGGAGGTSTGGTGGASAGAGGATTAGAGGAMPQGGSAQGGSAGSTPIPTAGSAGLASGGNASVPTANKPPQQDSGCGCRTAGGTNDSHSLSLLGTLIAALACLRRRKR